MSIKIQLQMQMETKPKPKPKTKVSRPISTLESPCFSSDNDDDGDDEDEDKEKCEEALYRAFGGRGAINVRYEKVV